MSALHNSTAVLDDIVAIIARTATNMVLGAHVIGSALNEAKEIFGMDNNAFGAWRTKHIEPLGISSRTARRMQDIALKFDEDSLPNVGLSVLYSIASDAVGPQTQEALLERVEADAKLGKATTAREVQVLVSKVHSGRLTAFDIRSETAEKVAAAPAAVVMVDTIEEAPTADVIDIPKATVKVDHGVQAKEYAHNIRKRIISLSKQDRTVYLFELKQELAAAGLLDIEEGLTVQAHKGVLSITK